MAKTREQKRADRKRRLQRQRHLQQNRARPEFVLTVKHEGEWRPVMEFSNLSRVREYVASVEEARRANSSDIVEGVVIHVKSGREVARIQSHTVSDPAMFKSERGLPESMLEKKFAAAGKNAGATV